jgi:hypothetical protein
MEFPREDTQPSKDNKNSSASGAAKLEKTSKKRKHEEVADESSSNGERTQKNRRRSVEDEILREEKMRLESKKIENKKYAKLGFKSEDTEALIKMTGNAFRNFAALQRTKEVINTPLVIEQTHQEFERLNTERLNYTIQHFPDDLLGKFQDACIYKKYIECHKAFPDEKDSITHLYRFIPSRQINIQEDFDTICDNTMKRDNYTNLRQVMNNFERDIKALHQQLKHPSEVINRIIGKIDNLNDNLGLPSVELLRMRREDLGFSNQPRDRRLVSQDYIPPTADQLRSAFRTFKDKVKQIYEKNPQHSLLKNIATKLNELEKEYNEKEEAQH